MRKLLRLALVMLWESVRHPLTRSVVDVNTGRVVLRYRGTGKPMAYTFDGSGGRIVWVDDWGITSDEDPD